MFKKFLNRRKTAARERFMHSSTFGVIFVILLIIVFVDFGENFRAYVDGEIKGNIQIESTGSTIGALPTPQPVEQVPVTPEEAHSYFVNFAFLNIRKDANIQAEIIRTLNQDDQVMAEATDNPEWLKVVLEDGMSGFAAKRYLSPLTKDIATQKGLLYLPILMYHYVSIPPTGSDEVREGLSVSPAVLWTHIKHIQSSGFETVTFQDLKEAKAGTKKLPEKAVILTFDDSYIDHYTNVFSLLKKLNLKGVFYVITDRVGTEGYITWDQLQEMVDAGMEIGSHAKGDLDLRFITETEGFEQIRDSKQILDKRLGIDVISFAYPSGHYASWLFRVLSRSGYHFARTTEYGKYLDIANHPFTLPTLRVKQSTTEADLVKWGIR
jgi:peptidoglycan/xylan/chitin deacetylase (PgdA/CDA1 family)